MPRQSSVDRAKLLDLLCTDMTETERARQLGVARSSYYAALDRLAADGVLVRRGDTKVAGISIRFRFSGGYFASARRASWDDKTGTWEVQGALLGEWATAGTHAGRDIAVVVRWTTRVIAFVAPEGNRWSSRDTRRVLPENWISLPTDTIKFLTVAIARVTESEAIILPGGGDGNLSGV